jgi:hypothetical protein
MVSFAPDDLRYGRLRPPSRLADHTSVTIGTEFSARSKCLKEIAFNYAILLQ